jgi:hypothetical protein
MPKNPQLLVGCVGKSVNGWKNSVLGAQFTRDEKMLAIHRVALVVSPGNTHLAVHAENRHGLGGVPSLFRRVGTTSLDLAK